MKFIFGFLYFGQFITPHYTQVYSIVCVFVCLLVTTLSCAKAAEPIDMPFGVWTRVGPRNHASGEAEIPKE